MGRLRVPGDLARLAEVRAFVRRELAAVGADDEATADLVQAVDELVSNIIEHGYGTAAGDVDVEIDADPDRVVVRLADSAPPFDPTAVPTPDLDLPLARRPLGGMGVHLARTLTDGMEHRILPAGGNELTLRKDLPDHTGNEAPDGHLDQPSRT